jgi:hypothetical protein
MTPSTAPTPATAKAAKTIIAAVESDEPPAFLRLCNDALRTHRRLAAARLDTIQTNLVEPHHNHRHLHCAGGCRQSQAGALVWPNLPLASEAAMSEDASGVRR